MHTIRLDILELHGICSEIDLKYNGKLTIYRICNLSLGCLFQLLVVISVAFCSIPAFKRTSRLARTRKKALSLWILVELPFHFLLVPSPTLNYAFVEIYT